MPPILTALCGVLLATIQLASASPLLGSTSLISGTLRPSELITRDLRTVSLYTRQSSSTDSECDLLSCSSSGASASNNTTASSSSSCAFLGGCSSGAGASCETNNNDVGNTSSSICGSSTSTNSSPFLDLGSLFGGSGSGKLIKRMVAVIKG